jgi:putative membrane protein
MSLSQLPTLNALLNGTSAILILLGYYFIRRREISRHRACMIAAILTSTLFLISYLIYHYHHPTTLFQGQGWVRPVYFFILFSHIILAIVIVPLVLITFKRGLADRRSAHIRIAKWTLPLWLYVSVTGVVVYLMLYQLYPAA